ncbi:radical SAM protein [Polymorphobacter glacialis]|uniref:Radical SAM protein n=1 Tax=Sandarakinorhabdus glacialis TaxID=1614636 RepID=A0A916ZL77_9SPHN|nr:PA0069 family radical SAM protein [Polymorphobacter glacialis]GGE03188.1 radical SAM protein [Polymorphobacter glacialis]
MPLTPPRPGRGATQNTLSSRFDDRGRVIDNDWRDDCEIVDDGAPPLRTTVTVEHPKTILTRNTSPDIAFDRSVNAYRGCEHGCIYCFARPTHAFHNLSPGLDFESKLFAKPNAAALLKTELCKRGYVCKPLAMGTNTDPYQPIERDWRITRSLLELLADCRHPVTITTKSDRVTRDIDLLAAMAADRLAAVMISVTSLDPATARSLEPRAPAPHRRLAAIRKLSAAGIPVWISISPVIPAITDHETEAIVAAGAEAGAIGAFTLPVRLPNEVAPLFRDWLAAYHPDRAARVMSHITEMRGGRDNDPDFHTRFRGQGPYAALMRQRFEKAIARHGLTNARMNLDSTLFRPPTDQLTLF